MVSLGKTSATDNGQDAGSETNQSNDEIDTALPAPDKETTQPLTVERRLSASDEATLKSSGKRRAPCWLKWMECPFAITAPSTGKKLDEATGWAMDASARAPVNQAGVFVGTALLRLAAEDVGCEQAADCENTVYGLRPSSLLTLTSAITGIVAALLMPIVGAIVDHTRHRKLVGSVSALILIAISAGQISISESNWLVILILEAIGGFTLLVHTTGVFAYLPDLTTDELDLTHYTSRFNIRQYAAQMCYVGILIIVGGIRGVGNSLSGSIDSARVALILAIAFAAPLFAYAWIFLFRKRSALSQVPEGLNLLTSGFIQVGRTCKRIWSRYHALKWFMISLLWSPEAGSGAVYSIILTFFTIFLQMNSQQIAYVSLITLAASLPGSLVAKTVSLCFNPLISYRTALVCFIISTAAACATLTGPKRQNVAYIFAALWGFAIGWMYPSQRVLFCTLIPKKQEFEIMGLFVTFGLILSWLPPLIFTALNERGIDMRWGLSIISFFSTLAFVCTLPMGPYALAVSQVSQHRQEMDSNE